MAGITSSCNVGSLQRPKVRFTAQRAGAVAVYVVFIVSISITMGGFQSDCATILAQYIASVISGPNNTGRGSLRITGVGCGAILDGRRGERV